MRPLVVGLIALAACASWRNATGEHRGQALEAACAADDQNACGVIANEEMQRGRLSKGWALAIASCDAGSPEGCAAKAKYLEDGVGPATEDEAAARSLYSFACDAGVAWGCVQAGVLLVNTKSYAAAAAASLRGCDGGDPLGCTNYGWIIDELWTEQIDRAEARRIFLSSCDAGVVAGCRRAGVSIAKGAGGPADPDAGLALLELTCYLRDGRGCQFGGHVLADAGRAEESTRFLRRACTFGYGCTDAMEALWGADGGADLYELRDTAEKACAHSRSSCAQFSRILLREGLREDALAIATARRACSAKKKNACDLLAELDAGLEADAGQ